MPYKTLQDLVRAAKANPGKLTYGSGGPGSAPHFATESFSLAAHADMRHIPYKSAGEAMTGLISGQIDVLMSSVPSLISQTKGGKARVPVQPPAQSPLLSATCGFAVNSAISEQQYPAQCHTKAEHGYTAPPVTCANSLKNPQMNKYRYPLADARADPWSDLD